jgi:hypothetical protein
MHGGTVPMRELRDARARMERDRTAEGGVRPQGGGGIESLEPVNSRTDRQSDFHAARGETLKVQGGT